MGGQQFIDSDLRGVPLCFDRAVSAYGGLAGFDIGNAETPVIHPHSVNGAGKREAEVGECETFACRLNGDVFLFGGYALAVKSVQGDGDAFRLAWTAVFPVHVLIGAVNGVHHGSGGLIGSEG